MNDNSKNNPQNIASFNPDLKSVLEEIEEGHYLFIIADRKKATLLLFNKGELEIKKEIMNPGVRKKTKINSGELYGKNNRLMRHIDNQLHHHLQLIMQETTSFIREKHINGVFLGGHKPLFHLIEKELPADLQKKLRGNFITELNIPEGELIKHSKHILEEYIK
jgi:hypothetical protein